LHVTIALNVEGEKPQLSPRPAVVFSKKSGAIYNWRTDARVLGAPHNPFARASEIPVMPVSIGFPAFRPDVSRRHDAAKALFCRIREIWNNAAHICGKAD
jgi:hypothetical protein